jgi:hypothetical protein
MKLPDAQPAPSLCLLVPLVTVLLLPVVMLGTLSHLWLLPTGRCKPHPLLQSRPAPNTPGVASMNAHAAPAESSGTPAPLLHLSLQPQMSRLDLAV